VLRSFQYRLNDRNLDQRSSQTAYLTLLPQLVSIVETSVEVLLRHTAIACLDRITEKFGKKDAAAVVDTAKIIAGESCLGAAEGSLRIISLQCLATMVEATGDAFISVIPKALPIAISHLETSIGEDTEDPSLHNAVYSLIGALLLYVPWAVTGADLDRLLTVSYRSANAIMGEECDRSRAEVLSLVAKQVEAKEYFAVLDRTWTAAMVEGPPVSTLQITQYEKRPLTPVQAVKEYLDILRLAIDRQPKSMIIKQRETLGDLLLHVFDLRRIQNSPPTEDSYDLSEIDEVEDAVNDCAIAMVYKLNDATFRPLFLRILEWATTPTTKGDKGTLHRQTTWFAFLLKFFDMLKVALGSVLKVSPMLIALP